MTKVPSKETINNAEQNKVYVDKKYQIILHGLFVFSLIVNMILFYKFDKTGGLLETKKANYQIQIQNLNEEIDACRYDYEELSDKNDKDKSHSNEMGNMSKNINAPDQTDFTFDDLSPILGKEYLPNHVIMDVKSYGQKHRASCEAASTHVAMDYFGADITEDQILEFIGADTQSRRYFDDQGRLHWGNPQKEYVGDVDAREIYVDGYGVYNKPIYKALQNFGFSNSISKINWDINELLAYTKRGFPAVVWVSNDYAQKDVGVMVGPQGQENPWIMDEHAVVLHGVKGTKIYIMDVGDGSKYVINQAKFERGFKNLNNMAIVVIPDKKSPSEE
jgi:uncharacterized protein YvpB